MEQQEKSLTLNGITGPHLLLLILTFIGAGISLYLTNHYMHVNYPSGLMQGSICDINSTFNCDASSTSKLSNILGIPISAFGLLFCINLFIASIFPSKAYEQANHLLAWVNLAGCLVLFVFSAFILGSFCPFCMGYWITSALILFMFSRYGLSPALPESKVLLAMVSLAIVVLGWFTWDVLEREKKATRMSYALINQFRNLPKVEVSESPHKIHMGTENFFDAPLRITEFSDFQCPACLGFAEIIPALITRYKSKINIQYFFFPLDANCNDGMKRQLHPMACQAAYLAHCSGEKFHSVHDDIFQNQRNLSQMWIDKKAEELNIKECKDSEETKNFVKNHLKLGDDLKVQSTPTLIINGKKISGSLPLNQLYLLLDQILQTQK